MAPPPPAWPDPWSLAHTERKPVDIRSELLRLHWNSSPMLPRGPGDDTGFEAIALGFPPRVEHETLVDIAHVVVPCADTPPSILADLIQRSPETRAIVMAEAPSLPPSLISLLLGSPSGWAHLASRADLDAPGTPPRPP